jgi:exopolysaccharide biosynthesis polyprenyl glycosylphosphotransferase
LTATWEPAPASSATVTATHGSHESAPGNERNVDSVNRVPAGGRRGWLMRRMLLAADLAALVTSFIIVGLVLPNRGDALRTESLLFLLSLPAWIILAKLYALYALDEEQADHSTGDELLGVFHLVTVGAFLFFASSWLTGLVHPSPEKIIGFWALGIVTMTAFRASARVLCRRQPAYRQHAVIVGAGEVGQKIALKLLRHPEYGIDVLGFVDSMPKDRNPNLGGLTILGQPAELPDLVRTVTIDRVIVAFSNDRYEETVELIRTLSTLNVCIDVVPRFFSLVGRNAGVHNVEGLPLISLPRPKFAHSTRLIKRAMDLLLSLLGLLVLLPLFALIAMKIKRDSDGPVFFRQIRMGEGGKTFELVKFRTMTVSAEKEKASLASLNRHASKVGDPRLFKIHDDPRVTGFGRFLRRYSLDELPQLINVIRGEMSLVGPRPLVVDEDEHVTEWRRRRLLVKPGMTGLWQVAGRDDISFEEMVELDYRYVADWSLVDDLGLLLRTLPAIVRERPVY